MTADSRIIAVADTLLDLEYETWNFGDSVAFEALLRATAETGDEKYAQFARAWLRSWATRRTPFRRLDATAPGVAMVHLLRQYGDGVLLTAAKELAEYLTARPKIRGLFATWESAPLMAPYGGEALDAHESGLLKNPPSGAFLDCLHFDPPFLTGLGVLTDDPGLVATGVDQALAYIRELQRPSGDFAHFVLEGVEGQFGVGWTRGQGWALLGLLDVIENVDAASRRGGPDRDSIAPIVVAARLLVERMISTQRPDGHWDALLDEPSSGMESSTAGFMAEGFRRAGDLGVSTNPRLHSAQNRARSAVIDSLDEHGQLGHVSVAVMACTRNSHYANVPRGYSVPWGQGPALLALTSGGRNVE